MKLHHDVLRWAHQVVQFGFLCCYKHQQKLWVKLYGLSVIWVFWNQGLGLSHVLFFFIVCVSTVFIVSLFRIALELESVPGTSGHETGIRPGEITVTLREPCTSTFTHPFSPGVKYTAFNLPHKWEIGITSFSTSVHLSYKLGKTTDASMFVFC